MVAVAWAAIGILAATLVGSLYYLGGRIDRLSDRIDGLGSSLSSRVDVLDARLSARIDALAAGMDAHIERHAR
jgi:hypothetical protein